MSNSMELTIQTYIAEKNDLEGQILSETMAKNLKHSHSSNAIAEIHNKYAPEISRIRNEINSLDLSASSTEYRKLMSELNELKDAEEREVEAEEAISTDYENRIQSHIDNDQTRLEAVNTDLEQLKETNRENIKNEFNYFQT